MQLTDLLKLNCIRVPLASSEKQDAIYELIELASERAGVGDVDALKEAVWKRELTRTTGIGHGLAVPHGKSDCCDRLIMAIGKPEQPIDFGSIDGKPVKIIFLLVGPVNQPGPHVQAMAQISRMMTNPEVRGLLFEAPDAEAVYEIILNPQKTLSSG